jgi:hypothetical protein
MTLQLIEQAEQDESGEYVYEQKIELPSGGTDVEKCNVTKLFTPGKRTTGDVDILVHEAHQAAEMGVDNPAYPADSDVANEACRKIIERDGLEPAWKDHEPTEWST